ncbi:hypothetical protein BCEP4_130050 [Burkholderia cepacia]|nr:hypothetical protein BCEP4_130050 [Burkholderia cepacia]
MRSSAGAASAGAAAFLLNFIASLSNSSIRNCFYTARFIINVGRWHLFRKLISYVLAYHFSIGSPRAGACRNCAFPYPPCLSGDPSR